MNQWMIDRLNGWMNEWVTGCLKRLSTSMNERTNEGTEEGRKAGREEGRKELGAINGMKEMKEWGMKGWRKECKNEGMKEGRNEGIEERRTEKKENGEMREHMHQWMNLVRSWVIMGALKGGRECDPIFWYFFAMSYPSSPVLPLGCCFPIPCAKPWKRT